MREFVNGLVLAAGVGAALSAAGDVDPNSAVPIAALCGIVAAVLEMTAPKERSKKRVSDPIYSLLGFIVCIPAVAGFVNREQCSELAFPTWARVVFFFVLLVVVMGAWGGAVVVRSTFSSSWFPIASGLNLLGLIEICMFLADFGLVFGPDSFTRYLMAAGGAAVFGTLVGLAPETLLPVAALSLGIGGIISAQYPDLCGEFGNPGGFVLLLCYTAVYFTVRAVASGLIGKGRRS